MIRRLPQTCACMVAAMTIGSCMRDTGPRIVIGSIERLGGGRMEWQIQLEKQNTLWEIGFDPRMVLLLPGAYQETGGCGVLYCIENRGTSPIRIVDPEGKESACVSVASHSRGFPAWRC